MIKISILSCKANNEAFASFIEEYNIQNNASYIINAFSSAESLCKSVESKGVYNMVFLDLEIEKALQAAHHIRNDLNDEETAIVIMSPYENCSSEIIKVHPLDYLVYPLDYEKTRMCINNYLGTRQMNSELFKYTRKRCKYQIPVSTIVYIQSNGKKIILHTKNEAIDFYGRLSDCINNKCFKNFIQIHQSFFVNSEYIEKISQNHLILNGNVRLPISRQRKKNVKVYFKN